MNARVSILKDPYGRFYEDFYKVVASGERRDDWAPVLVMLKQHFTRYLSHTNCRGKPDTIPKGVDSSSLDGNFLEAINLSMNGK